MCGGDGDGSYSSPVSQSQCVGGGGGGGGSANGGGRPWLAGAGLLVPETRNNPLR